jgi:hypothetical protein
MIGPGGPKVNRIHTPYPNKVHDSVNLLYVVQYRGCQGAGSAPQSAEWAGRPLAASAWPDDPDSLRITRPGLAVAERVCALPIASSWPFRLLTPSSIGKISGWTFKNERSAKMKTALKLQSYPLDNQHNGRHWRCQGQTSASEQPKETSGYPVRSLMYEFAVKLIQRKRLRAEIAP